MDFETQLFIDGQWRPGHGGQAPVLNPANEETIGSHAVADKADLDDALAAALRGFAKWRSTSAFERSKVMRRAAEFLRERNESVARAMTMEQGKPLAESRMEAAAGADVIDWLAEEGRRAYGRIVPGRAPGVSQMVVKEPVGPVAAFSPWNFPINQAVRKISAALAAGCRSSSRARRIRLRAAPRWSRLSPTPACRPVCSTSCSATLRRSALT